MADWLDVSDTTPRIAYVATASQTAFTVPFVFFEDEDLLVYKNNVLLTLATDYTVAGEEVLTGGTVTLLVGATVGDAIMIVRDVAIEQTTHIPPSGPLDIPAVNFQISKLIAIDQQLNDKIDRSITLPDSEPSIALELPTAALRANKALTFDAAGNLVFISVVGGTLSPDAANINYTPAGTGAAVRSVQSRLRDQISVLDFIPVAQHAAIANGTTVYDATANIQAAITAAAGSPVLLPAGTYIVTSQLTYNTTAGTFTPALKLSGAGVGKTIIDNRVANNSCIVAQSTVGNNFQLNGWIRDLTIKTTTSPVVSVGIELKGVYQFTVENVHIIGMTSHGAKITCALGDADASNIVVWRGCRFENNVGAGLYSNYSAGITQPSFVRVDDCLFSGNTLCGWYYIGLQGTMINTAFVINVGPGLWMPYNGSSNAQFYAASCSFENNGGATAPQVRIDSLQGGEFNGTEIASTVIGFPAVTGFSLEQTGTVGAAVQSTRIEGTRVRITAAFNPYTMFRLGVNATTNVISNTFWQSYDGTGQVRYVVNAAAYGNRMSDSFAAIQVGQPNGVTSVTMATGTNANFVLPLDGTMFSITGPGGAFSTSGFAGGSDGRTLVLLNQSGQTLTILADNAGSTAANRIYTDSNANVTVNNVGNATFRYFQAAQRWIFTGKG